MSSIFHQRRRTQRQIDWPLYREQRAYLADLFPAIRYSGQPKQPLAIGIKYELIGANTGFAADDIKHFLRAYTFGPKYLRALKAGAWRYALDGAADGWVSPNEAEQARLALQAHYADRERRRAVREVGVRAVAAVMQPNVLFEPDWTPYPYRFAREAA